MMLTSTAICSSFAYSHFDSYSFFFFSSRRRHTRYIGDWSSDVCSSDLSASNGSSLLLLMRWNACWERQRVACSTLRAKDSRSGWSRPLLRQNRCEHHQKQEGSGNMRNIVAATIFRLIQIAWSPIALVGYV